MGVRGSDPFVEQVRMATEILTVIGGYVELHKAGRRWRGLCPFHAEKTPSFFVNQESQTYYCFGCHQGGDVFRFLMEQEKLSFPETLRMLAEKAGIPVPRRRPRSGDEGDHDRLVESMEVAAEFFRARLRSPEGKPALDYLHGRGLNEATIERFGLGWAPASWDALLRHAGRLLPERILLKAGLVIEGERGLYDRFRERIVVPIRTAGGRTVAFGGRILGAGEPKYMNSPETPLYKKGNVLFGLPEARDSIRAEGNVLVVEGYFDVIGLSQAGIGWVVGTCGTALTPEQALLLRRYTESWTLLFDGDAAGRSAMLRALDVAVPVHPGARAVLCPAGQDPDSWVRAEGAEAVRAAISHSLTPLQVLEDWAREHGQRAETVLGRVADLLRKVGDPMVRDLWIQEAAGRFRLRESAIAAALGPLARSPVGPGRPDARDGGPRPGASPSRLAPPERQVVAAALQSPGLAGALLQACRLLPEFGAGCRRVLEWIEGRFEEGIVHAPALLSRASEEGGEGELWRDLSFVHEDVESLEEVPRDLLRNLRKRVLIRRKRELTDRIRRAEERGEEVRELQMEQQRVATALRDLDAAETLPDGNFP